MQVRVVVEKLLRAELRGDIQFLVGQFRAWLERSAMPDFS